jgi:hypothetical protein
VFSLTCFPDREIFISCQAQYNNGRLTKKRLLIPFLDETATYFTPRLTPSPLGKGGLQGVHKAHLHTELVLYKIYARKSQKLGFCEGRVFSTHSLDSLLPRRNAPLPHREGETRSRSANNEKTRILLKDLTNKAVQRVSWVRVFLEIGFIRTRKS